MQMSLLRIKDGAPVSVGDIVAQVEEVEDKVMCKFDLPVLYSLLQFGWRIDLAW